MKKIQVLTEVSKNVPKIPSLPKPPKPLSEAKIAAKNFFLEDNVSVVLPGKKDVKRIVIDGEKTTVNVRVLNDSLKNLFHTFKDQNPTLKIGQTIFNKCVPAHVKHFQKMPIFSCLCKDHENFHFAYEAVKKFITNSEVSNTVEFLSLICCSLLNFQCMVGMCVTCKSVKAKVREVLEFQQTQMIKFTIWEQVDGKHQKVKKTLSTEEFLEHFATQIKEFKIHYYVHRMQSQAYSTQCKTFSSDTAIAVFDFSEKFSNACQYEIAPRFFQRETFVLFTGAFIVSNPETGQMKCECYSVMSDKSEQDKFSVFSFMKLCFLDILKKFPNIKIVRIWSDNCTGQFKNIFTLANMAYFQNVFGLKIYWYFHVRSHGKTIVDGIGAIVKNMTFRRIKSQNIYIQTAFEFYEEANRICDKINIFFASESLLNDDKKIVSGYFKTIIKNPVKNFRRYHFFEILDVDLIRCATTHLCEDALEVKIPSSVGFF